MGVLLGTEKILDGLGRVLTNPFSVTGKKGYSAHDYTEGFCFLEATLPENERIEIKLTGTNMPHVPFKHGGNQRTKKEFYPGNSEATIQVLGAEETDVMIEGRLYAKKYRDRSMYEAPHAFQVQLTKLRRRGNLLMITLGDWKRYGYLTTTEFEEKNRGDMDYKLTFLIIGDQPPTNCYQLTETKDIPRSENAALISAAEDFQKKFGLPDPTVDQTISEKLNALVSEVSDSVNAVTTFVGRVMSQAEAIEASVTRALGLIKVARNALNIFARRAGNLSYRVQQDAMAIRYLTISKVSNSLSAAALMTALLAKLQAQFEALKKTVPKARYRVANGDTLQRISIKFYGSAGNWEKIYDHNKLTSTALTVGSVLEIPN